jgi:PadR family transcriptional regulator, regulatory protein PadR
MNLPSKKEIDVLRLLSVTPEMYGLEMVKATSSLKRGTIYTMLSRIEAKGWIASRQEKAFGSPGMPRRLYRMTGRGKCVMRAYEIVETLIDEPCQ